MDPLNAPTFRIRKNGQVSGPFARTHIRMMARRGEVGLTDEVSLNGGQWVAVIRTPLAAEVPRKPGVTLQGKRGTAASAKDDTLFAMPAISPQSANPWKPAAAAASAAPAKPRPTAPPLAKERPTPAAAQATVRAPAQASQEPAQEADPFADWAQGGSDSVSRRTTRRKPKRKGGGGLSMEAFFLWVFALLALAVIVGAAFVFGRRTGTATAPQPPAQTASAAPGPAASAAPALSDWKAFVGHAYGLWEMQSSAAPAMRFRLLSDGRCERIDAGNVAPDRQVHRWTVTGGELLLLDGDGKATYRFPAQARQGELVGTFYGKKWRKLTLEH